MVMKIHARPNWLRGLLAPLMCLSMATAALGQGIAPERSPLPPAIEGADHILVLLCRLGAGEMPSAQTMQELPQELPMICLVTDADEEVVHMGAGRFNELLDVAASSGRMTVFVFPPAP
jgi:hypothetical protein